MTWSSFFCWLYFYSLLYMLYFYSPSPVVCLLWIMVYAIVCASMVSTAKKKKKKKLLFICPCFIIIYAKFSYLEGGGVCEFIGIKKLVFTFVLRFCSRSSRRFVIKYIVQLNNLIVMHISHYCVSFWCL